jgi:hypothetical protein
MKTGYIKNKKTGKVESYYELPKQPNNTDKHEFIECAKKDLPEIYIPEPTAEEKRQQLISQKKDEILTRQAEQELKAEGKL